VGDRRATVVEQIFAGALSLNQGKTSQQLLSVESEASVLPGQGFLDETRGFPAADFEHLPKE